MVNMPAVNGSGNAGKNQQQIWYVTEGYATNQRRDPNRSTSVQVSSQQRYNVTRETGIKAMQKVDKHGTLYSWNDPQAGL